MIPQSELHKGLKAAGGFIDEGKPGLHVIHFHFKTADTLETVATDGHKLVVIEYSYPHGVPVGTRVSIPLAMIREILKKFPVKSDQDVTVMYFDNKLLFTNGVDTHTVQGPPPSEYADYEKAIAPCDLKGELVALNPILWASILKDCKPLMRSKSAHLGGPRVTMAPRGAEEALPMRFTVDDDLECITGVIAYLMPLGEAP